MGLGITLSAKYGLNKNKRIQKVKEYFDKLPSVIPDRKIKVYNQENGLQVSLVPFEENLYVNFEEKKIAFSAKTNSAGPGYHAYVVNILDNIGLKWTSDNIEDETGYYTNRDYEALKKSMSDWLCSLSNILIREYSNGEVSNLAVSMPLEMTPVGGTGFVCNPLGFWDMDFFKNISQNISENSNKFFIWWDKDCDAVFYTKCASASIWCDANWLVPYNEYESETYQLISACLNKAYELEPDADYPVSEWLEIASLTKNDEMTDILKKRFKNYDELDKATLGFMHGDVSCLIGNGWNLTRPGKMHFEYDNCCIWWDDERTIRASLISVEPKGGGVGDNQALLDSSGNGEAYEPFEQLKNTNIKAKIMHGQIEENGKFIPSTQMLAAFNNQLLILSLYYEKIEDREWALKVCSSVSV